MKKNQPPPSEMDRLRRRAEAQLQDQLTRFGQPPPTATETVRLVHELQVHQTELELQNHALLEMRDQLEQRLEKYADLYDFAPLGYFTLAADGTIQELNLAGATLLGQERSRLIHQRFGFFVSTDTLAAFNTFLAATLIGASRKTCEIVLSPEGSPPRFMRLEGIGMVSGADHQCRVAAIDITERKQAEMARQQSELFTKDVLNSLSVHIAVLDAQGVITLVNAAWRRFFEQNGGDASCHVGVNYLNVCRNALAGDDSAEAQAALQGIYTVISGAQVCFHLEYPCHSPTESRWFVMRVFPLSGDRQGAVIAHEDITARKQSEKALREKADLQEQLAKVAASAPGLICSFRLRPDGSACFPYASPFIEEIYGVTAQEVATDAAPLFTRLHPDDVEPMNATIAESARALTPWHDEFRFQHPHKGERWFEGRSMPQVESDGSILWHGFVTDITERKRMEEALRRSEAKYRTLHESMSDAFVSTDMSGYIIEFNRVYQEMVGYSAEELFMLTYQDLTPEKWRAFEAKIVEEQILARGYSDVYEKEYRRKDGTIFPAELRTFLIQDAAGQPDRMWAIVRDITERKQAEQTLRQYQYIVSAIPDSIALVDRNYIYRVVNAEYLRRTGKDYDAIVGHSVADLLGEEVFQNSIKEKLDRCLAGDTLRFQEWLDFQNKGRLFLDVTFSPYHDEQGGRSGIVVSTRDITAIKRAEQAWQASEARFRTLAELLPYGIQEIDRAGRVTFANPALERLYGPSVGRFIWDFLADDSERQPLRDYLEFLVREQPPPTTYFSKDRRPDGSVIDCQIDWTYLYDAHGQVRGFLSVIADITEKKRMHEALRESETRFRLLLEQTPSLAAQGYSPDGTVHYWNAAAETIYGYTVREAIGQNLLDLIIPPEMRSEVKQAIQQMATTGQPLPTGELSLMHKDGGRVAVLSSHAVIQIPGKGVELFCLDMDISERKRIEEALRHSLTEKETLLREVHHRVKNNLAAIIGLIDLRRNLLTDAPTVSLLIELRSRIKSMALVHEMLYQSGALNRIDFHAYLQALIGHLRGSFDPRGAIQINVAAADLWMSLDAAIPCGLIVSELVINALKYAFPLDQSNFKSSTRDISITATAEGENYTLIVADNGIGLPADLDWTATKTLGLRLVRMLGQHQLQGQLELDRTDGTRFSLRFSARQPDGGAAP